MKIKLKNLILALKDQGPFGCFMHNFFVSGNGWGLFSKRSHYRENGPPKVTYNTKETAYKIAMKMSHKYGKHFSHYKCIYCDGYHLGTNKENK